MYTAVALVNDSSSKESHRLTRFDGVPAIMKAAENENNFDLLFAEEIIHS